MGMIRPVERRREFVPEFPIESFVGVGQLKFGMHLDVAHALLGPPMHTRRSRFSPERTECWIENGLQLTFLESNGILQDITLFSNVGIVTLGELNVFAEPRMRSIQTLCKMDGHPLRTVGVTVLLNLGVALSGFESPDADDWSISVFAAGRWKKDDPSLSPVQP